MRGLEEIKDINENPHGRPTEEHFGTKFVGPDTTHETQDAARTASLSPTLKRLASNLAAFSVIDQLFFGSGDDGSVAELAAVATVLDTFGLKHPANYDDAKALALKTLSAEIKKRNDARPMDRIMHGIDQPPFIEFWADLNAKRESVGLPEALYGEAKILFQGGPTPVGAMTFIGAQWDGLRAVPSEPVKVLGGQRPSYHAQYRQTTRLGVKWHTVKDHGVSRIFRIPEEAVTEAEKVRNYRAAHEEGFKS